MSLINCKACGKEVSSEAKSCPHCGDPINPGSGTASTVLKVLLILFIVVIGFVGFMYAVPTLFFVGHKAAEQIDTSKINNTEIQITQLESALKLFKVDNGFYPDTEQGLQTLVEIPTIGRTPTNYDPLGYIEGDVIPNDQWGNSFIYLGPDKAGARTYEVISKGPDGVPNTTDDISSRDIK